MKWISWGIFWFVICMFSGGWVGVITGIIMGFFYLFLKWANGSQSGEDKPKTEFAPHDLD